MPPFSPEVLQEFAEMPLGELSHVADILYSRQLSLSGIESRAEERAGFQELFCTVDVVIADLEAKALQR